MTVTSIRNLRTTPPGVTRSARGNGGCMPLWAYSIERTQAVTH